jgi:PEP-CTERM/exosortase A-associated glycosyltransferase
MRILHVLHHSVPYLDGYGVRSKYIVDFQRRLGLSPVVVTSAHHEIEMGRSDSSSGSTESHEGISYYRTAVPADAERLHLRLPVLRELALMRWLSRSIERVLASEPVDLIHAHSPILCGRPALAAARRRGIPIVYEVRAFWEDAFLVEPGRFGRATVMNVVSRTLETALLKKVDAAVAISKHMVKEIAARGIDRDRLFHVPNGVDVDRFAPVARDAELARSLGLESAKVVGFIGTLHSIEGLDCLIDAMPLIRARVPGARLVIVGSGPEAANLKAQTERLGLRDVILHVGRVPHDEVLRYYSVMDALVYPRHRARITELVTPLKPLEAMALGKPTVGSDVGGITELLDDGRAGSIFRAGDAADLATKVSDLLTDPAHLADVAAKGRAYVLAERRWEKIAANYLPIYERLVKRSSRSRV